MREKIIVLRSQGLSYREIERELGCARSTISYHLGSGQKEKALARGAASRAVMHPAYNKWSNFVHNSPRNAPKSLVKTSRTTRRRFLDKVTDFQKHSSSDKFTLLDAIDKFGAKPSCYLSGAPIDLGHPETYHFDHITPRSRGGDNSLGNLGLASKQANMSKSDLSLEEYLLLCQRVLETHGYSVVKNDP